MTPIKRCMIVFLTLILLPLSPARAEPQDEPYWRGTVTVTEVQRGTQEQWLTINGENVQVFGRFYEYKERKIIFNPNGGITEQLKYSFYREDPWPCDTYPYTYVGRHFRESNEAPPPTHPLYSIQVSDDYASVVESGTYFPHPEITYHDRWTCAVGTQENTEHMPIPTPWALSQDEGDFSADSSEIVGYSENLNYTNGSHITSVVYNLTKQDMDNPYHSEYDKGTMDTYSDVNDFLGYGAGVGVGIACAATAGVGCLVAGGVLGSVFLVNSWWAGERAEDPPDPNFTEIASPITPTTSQQPVLPDASLSQTQADAFNALITNMEQEIGLEAATLTSFNRASGALQANDGYWMEQQLQAARTYSGQLANLLEARIQLLLDLKSALETSPGITAEITSDDIAQDKYDLLTNGIPPEQAQVLAELGLDERGRAEVKHAMILAEFPGEALNQGLVIARFPDLLTDPELVSATLEYARVLREFAEGEGWKVYAPLIGR